MEEKEGMMKVRKSLLSRNSKDRDKGEIVRKVRIVKS